MALERELKIEDGDGVYAAVIEAHQGLTLEQSAALNARLVLLLANHIGDGAVIREALAKALAALPRPTSS
jgi:hypothetical protein